MDAHLKLLSVFLNILMSTEAGKGTSKKGSDVSTIGGHGVFFDCNVLSE